MEAVGARGEVMGLSLDESTGTSLGFLINSMAAYCPSG